MKPSRLWAPCRRQFVVGCPRGCLDCHSLGELAYEIAVPSRYGDGLVRALMDAGKDYDAVAYGTEALGVMRVEKGHAAGNELNGTTTAADLGLGRMVSKKRTASARLCRCVRPYSTRPSHLGWLQTSRPQLLAERRCAFHRCWTIGRSEER